MFNRIKTGPKKACAAIRHAAWGIALASALGGCATSAGPSAGEVYAAARPAAAPAHTQTNFSDSLRCMDDMLFDYGIRDIRLTTNGIPDATGEIQTGTREMFISAVTRMSARSRAFTYVDLQEVTDGYGPSEDRRLYARQQQLLTPTYYVRGAITTFDDSVASDSRGGGISFGGAGAGANVDATSSVVGVDMNVGEVQTGLILAGASSSNRITVTRRGQSVDGSFDVELGSESLGAFAQVSRNRSEGMHTAIRTLIELNTIESLGKLARVPYWRCLGVEQTDPAASRQVADYFRTMEPAERIAFAQRGLQSLSLYAGPADGMSSPLFRDAVGQYQAANGLVATGEVNTALISSLMARDLRLPGPGMPALPTLASEPDPLFILMTDALEFPTYQAGMPLDLRIRLNDDAQLYCFYQDGVGHVARVFPNRFSPNPQVRGGEAVRIPGPQDGFRLVFETPGSSEQVRCFATRNIMAADASGLMAQPDLTPLAVRDLDEVEAAIRSANPDEIASNTLEFLIR